MTDVSLSTWLRNLREKHGVPLRVVAAAVDMDSTLLSKLEVGDRVPTDTQAEALRRYYGVTAEEMRRRVLAARILHDYGGDPILPEALSLVREEASLAAEAGAKRKKPVTYRKGRRKS